MVSVELENRGFDLIFRRPHPEDPHAAIEVRFMEVKGRAGVGEVAQRRRYLASVTQGYVQNYEPLAAFFVEAIERGR